MPFNTGHFKRLKLAGCMLALLPGVGGLKAADSIVIRRPVIAEGNARKQT